MITITFDARAVVKKLNADLEKQMKFALQETLNTVATVRQKNLQKHIASNLTIRKGKNLFREVVRFAREDRADRKLDRFRAVIRIIGSPQLQGERDKYRRVGAMVLRQDSTGTATSNAVYRSGRESLSVEGFAIPAPGLRTASKPMALGLYPHNVGVSLYRKPDGGNFFANTYKGGKYKRGKRRGEWRDNTRFYFVKKGVGIFVRQQVGKHSEYDAVWFFRRQIQLPKRLKIEATFNNGLGEQLQATFNRKFADALRTAR